jgi:hypothetical protein
MIKKIAITPNVVARQVGNETVVLHLGSATYFGLNAVGARFWQLVEEGKNFNEICDTVVGEFEVTRDELERDIRFLIKDLLAQDLISLS